MSKEVGLRAGDTKLNPLLTVLLILLGLSTFLPQMTPALSLILGIVTALYLSRHANPDQLKGHQTRVKKWSTELMKVAIVGSGFGISLEMALQAGWLGALVTFASITLTLLVGGQLGKWFKVDPTTSTLLSFGTAICGGSAIAAIVPVLRPKDEAVSASLLVIFLLNAVGLIIFPVMGHWLGLTQEQFAWWAGISIHDTSSVVGATARYGDVAQMLGTTVKLVRALWIIPFVFFFAWRGTKARDERSTAKITYPWFIVIFFLVVALHTYLPNQEQWAPLVFSRAKKLFGLVLFMIGLQFQAQKIKGLGLPVLFQALCLWAIVALSSLAVILLSFP